MSTIELEGRTLAIPVPITALASDDRVALALVTGAAVRFGDAFVESAIAPCAVDLSLVRAGRAPLLAEHYVTLNALLGQVVGADIDGPVLRCLVRFAPGEEPDRLWGMLQAGFPLSLSVGATVQHAERVADVEGKPVYRATRWRLREVSVCVFGRDEAAYDRRLADHEDANSLFRDMYQAGGERQAAVRSALHLDRWQRWAGPTAAGLSEQLGSDPDATATLLAAAVERHCEQLITDFAA